MPAQRTHVTPNNRPVGHMIERRVLIERALALKRAVRAERNDKPLRGRHIGLICKRPDSRDARLFRQAASLLGARVACIGPGVAGALDAADLTSTARLLSRLYDAVECQGLPADRVSQIRGQATIPVFDCIGAKSAADAECAATMDRETGDTDGRFYLLQAALVSMFA